MQTILLIEDSREFQLIVKKTLNDNSYQLLCADGGEDALKQINTHVIDLILLDVMLPDHNGFDLFTRLQSEDRTKNIPVIFLTGKEEVTLKVAAFSLGADDYIVKPFNPMEFKARIEAKLRRIQRTHTTEDILKRGPLQFILSKQLAIAEENGKPIQLNLTPIEFKLLFHLARSEGHIYSRQQLLDSVWGKGVHVFDRTVDTHISALRKKLGSFSKHIESVPGTGYKFSLIPSKSVPKSVAKRAA